MRPWMEKWGSVLLIFLCALVILFSALYTRQDDLKRIVAQNAATDQSEKIADLPRYQSPVSGEITQSYLGAFKTEGGLWRMDPCVHYTIKKSAKVLSCCDGVIVRADENQIIIQSGDRFTFHLRGSFTLCTSTGDFVAAGQEIASAAAAGELLLSISSDGQYLDPLSCFTP